jgi:ABC-type antimicrobial peptide transport system permease subunit
MYFADTQEPDPSPFLTVLLRTDGDPNTLRPLVTRAAAETHPAITLGFTEMRTQMQNSLLRERLMAALSGGFAVLAVILAAVGLYGLMSYGVTRRRNEIGIRIALGATRSGIVGMIVRETALLVAIGTAIGLAGAIYSARAASALLFGFTGTDARVLALGAVALAVVAAIATVIPATRAARLQPTIALREET